MFKRFIPAAGLVVALAFAGAALAGNGGGASKSSSGSSISAPVVVSSTTSSAASTAPSYGQTVTFNVSTSETTNAYVDLKCSQGGTQVGEGWGTFFAGGTPGTFVLASPQWAGGAADCTADLGMFTSNGKWKVLASTSFHVNG